MMLTTDDSETEPESDAESQTAPKPSKHIPLITSKFSEDDSETEPEDDGDETENSVKRIIALNSMH
jgi:hypothetical protein